MYYLEIREVENHCFRLRGTNCHASLSSSPDGTRKDNRDTNCSCQPSFNPVSACQPRTVHAIFFQICRLGSVPPQESPYSTKAFSLLASLNLCGEGQLGTPQLRNCGKRILPQSMGGSQG